MSAEQQRVSDWWRTSIIEMEPGVIRYRGYPIQELIGRIGFAEMIWLMTRGEPGACSACRARSASWRTPGNRASKAAATRGPFHANTAGRTTGLRSVPYR